MDAAPDSTRPGFTICICPDGRLLRNELEARVLAWPPPARAGSNGPGGPSGWTRRTFWGDEELPGKFWETLSLQGLFATAQALVLRNAHNLTAEAWRRLNSALAGHSSLTWPFLCLEGAWEKGQPKIPAHIQKLRCFSHAQARGWIWRQPPLDSRGIRRHVAQRAGGMRLRLEGPVLDALAAVLPPDAGVIENELDKLALLADDGLVTPAMIAAVHHVPSFDIFSFLRHMQNGRAASAWKNLLQDDQGEERIFPLLGLMQREARLLWQLRAGESPYVPASSEQEKRRIAMRLGFTGLTAMWEAMQAAEYAVKSGARTPSQALDALIGELTRLFGRLPDSGSQSDSGLIF
jgi:DNA polymerase-3 subunit delta